jgi:hypothetical protein
VVVDWATLDYLREDEDTKEEPKKLASPRSGLSIQPTPRKIHVRNPWSGKKEDATHQRPKLGVWHKYLDICLTARRCEVLGDAWKQVHRHTKNWMSGLIAVK